MKSHKEGTLQIWHRHSLIRFCRSKASDPVTSQAWVLPHERAISGTYKFVANVYSDLKMNRWQRSRTEWPSLCTRNTEKFWVIHKTFMFSTKTHFNSSSELPNEKKIWSRHRQLNFLHHNWQMVVTNVCVCDPNSSNLELSASSLLLSFVYVLLHIFI